MSFADNKKFLTECPLKTINNSSFVTYNFFSLLLSTQTITINWMILCVVSTVMYYSNLRKHITMVFLKQNSYTVVKLVSVTCEQDNLQQLH